MSAAIARAFSFAILAVAFISLTALRKGASPQTVKNVIVILTVYHLAQLLAQFVNAAMFPPLLIPPVVIHVVFSTLFIGAWVRSSRNVARPDHVRRASMPAELT